MLPAFGPTLFVHLSRRDKLAQAISLVKANQTGLWHRSADGTELERLAPPRPPVYDAARIGRTIADLTAQDGAWRAWFTREGIEPLRIDYEALSRDPKDTLAAVLTRLDRVAGGVRSIDVPLAKLSDATNRSWARRFLAERG